MKLSNLVAMVILALVMCRLTACTYSTQSQPPPQNSTNDWAAGVFSSPVAPIGTNTVDAGPR
jgi:flagellar basal body-associated protein FliL